MSGGEVSCGSFSGLDKSASAIEGVLETLIQKELGSDVAMEVRTLLDRAEEMYIEIPTGLAARLLPHLRRYRKLLVDEIGHDDWSREALAEDEAGLDGIEAKWGKSRGWKLYCATDMY